MANHNIKMIWLLFTKNMTYRKRRWLRSIMQILIPLVLFFLFAYIRSKIDNLEKKVVHEAVCATEYCSESLYNDRFDHETKIYFTPCNSFTHDLVYRIQIKFQINIEATKCYDTQQELLTNAEYNETSVIAIIFENLISDTIPQQLSYEIRPYQEHVHWDITHLYKSASTYTPDLGSAQYLYNGILAMQMALESSFVEMVTNKDLPVTVQIQEFPYPPYTDKSGILDMFNYILPLITMLAFMFSCAMFLPQTIEDKTSGMKEFLKMNGVRYWIILLVWFMDEFIINFFATLVIMIFLTVPLLNSTPPIENCNFWLLLIFLTLYSVSMISYCLVVGSFFSKSTHSVVFALLLWIVSYMLPSILMDLNVSVGWDLLYALLPNGLLIFGFRILTTFEIRNTKASWHNVFESPSGGPYELAMGHILLMYLGVITFYITLALINDTGLYLYLSTRETKNKKKECNPETTILMEGESSTAEKNEISNLSVSIQIKNLCKNYGNKTAVNNISINIYNEQITVLLGKNGAGKTTMLSMITGMLRPSSGTITYINGDDSSISFCPQHNLQFSSLTVTENLLFFGRLRGLSKKDAIDKSKELLKLMNLTEKGEELIYKLSEGMRRKLSLSMAVIGDSNIIILDEPSSGLDPDVRRDVWNFIITLRGFRTVLVTTHLMEEAEALSDQIIIVNDGSVIAYGSPMSLASKYGVGYKLHINLKNGSNKDNIVKLASNFKTRIELLSDTNVKLILNKDEKKEYIELLEKLENEKEKLQIQHLNFEYTSLEEVFLNSLDSKLTQFEKNETENSNFLLKRKKPSKTTYNVNEINFLKKFVRKYKFFLLISKCALFTKWRIHFTQILLLLFTILIILFFGEWDNRTITHNNVVEFKLSKYGATKTFFSVDSSNVLYKNISSIYNNLIEQELGDPNSVSNVSEEIILEGLQNIEFYKKHMIVSAEFKTRSNGQSIANAMYSNNAVQGSSISITLIFNALLKSFAGNDFSISSKLNPLPNQLKSKPNHIYIMQLTSMWCVLLTLIMVIISGLFIIVPQIERTSNLKHLQIMSGVSRTLYWFTWYIWNIGLHVLVVSITIIFVILINNCFNISNIFTTNEISTLYIILVVYGIAVLPYSYLYTHIQLKSKALAYFMILNLFLGQILMLFILYFETSNDDYLENLSEYMAYFFNLFPVFALRSTIAKFVKKAVWNYNWEHTLIEQREAICRSKYNPCCDSNNQRCNQFKSYISIDDPAILICLFEMFASTILYIIILTAVEVCLVQKLIKFLRKKKTNTDKANVGLSAKEGPNSEYNKTVNHAPKNNLFHEEELSNRRKTRRNNLQENDRNFQDLDSSNSNSEQVSILQVNDLTKKLGGKEVLKKISFQAPKNVCIGLLGPNGAGKTTISRLLAKEELPDSGEIILQNLNQNKLGYCPQNDCSSSLINAKDALKLFGKLRGLNNVNSEVTRLIDSLDLTECADKVSSTYSGGNKRKLGTAIALIGKPDLILLDEPTAGVDPISRHKMRNELKLVRENSSMIISTHIIEDCESLCNKLVVIKNGTALPSESILELKNKFNKNVIVKLKITNGIKNTDTITNKKTKLIKEIKEWENIESNEVKTLKKEFCKIFVESNLEDQHASLLKYSIAITIAMYNCIYRKVEDLQKQHSIIEDYEIYTSTLENAYLSITKNSLE